MTQSMGLSMQILNKPSSLSEKGRYLREEKKLHLCAQLLSGLEIFGTVNFRNVQKI